MTIRSETRFADEARLIATRDSFEAEFRKVERRREEEGERLVSRRYISGSGSQWRIVEATIGEGVVAR